MHTVHTPDPSEKNGFKYAATGVLFSVNNSNALLNNTQKKMLTEFFDKLELS